MTEEDQVILVVSVEAVEADSVSVEAVEVESVTVEAVEVESVSIEVPTVSVDALWCL